MKEKQFWEIISQMHHIEEPYDWVINELSRKTETEIAQFEIQFEKVFMKAYTSNLWGAAYIIMGGCSDDSFEYFRGWLIGQGEEVYNKAVKDPDYLAEYILPIYEQDELVPELEEMLDLGLQAYTVKKTGDIEWNDKIWNDFNNIVEGLGYHYPKVDIEFDWKDVNDLKDCFPKLWKRFGENPLG